MSKEPIKSAVELAKDFLNSIPVDKIKSTNGDIWYSEYSCIKAIEILQSRLSSLEADNKELEADLNHCCGLANKLREEKSALEAENQKLREALSGLVCANKKYKYTNGLELYDAYLLAEIALKNKP